MVFANAIYLSCVRSAGYYTVVGFPCADLKGSDYGFPCQQRKNICTYYSVKCVPIEVSAAIYITQINIITIYPDNVFKFLQ